MQNGTKLAMISTWIRRDLHEPLRHFQRVDVAHFYRHSIHRDVEEGELEGAVKYTNPIQLFRELQISDPDIIQGAEPFALLTLPYVFVGWLYARLHKLPLIVISPENRPLSVKYGRFAASLLRLVLRKYFNDASLVVFLNEGSKQSFLECGVKPHQLVRHMYGTWGVDLESFTPDSDEVHRFRFAKTLFYVGRLDRMKGLFDLLDALRIVVEEHPDVGLVLAGSGPDEQALREQVTMFGLDEHVEFTGPILNRLLPPYFRGCDVFVSPAVTTRQWEEQIGMTNIQAMACGVPVVSTLSGAIPEYVPDGHAGLLVPQRDPKELARAILSLLDDTGLAEELASNAREYALRKYDARRNIEQIEDVLLSIEVGFVTRE